MRIVGIHTGHNASACMLVDGEVVAALQEERVTREKNQPGLPREAFRWVMEYAGVRDADEVDAFVFTDICFSDHQITRSYERTRHHFTNPPSRLSWQTLKNAAEGIPPLGREGRAYRLRRRARELGQLGIPSGKLVRVDHHLAHASSAYYGWGRLDEPVLVLTCDGQGDELCATVSVGQGGTLRRIASVPGAYSIGNLYAMVTLLLGMKPLEHEYKLMGMAPYASAEHAAPLAALFSAYYEADPANPLGWRTARGVPETYWIYPRLRRDLEFKRFDSICGGLQLWIEDFVVDWVQRCIDHTGIRRLALSGGVFMNVKVNKRIAELPDVDDLFIFPSCGDETNPIGASYLEYARRGRVEEIKPMGPCYLGPCFEDAAFDDAVERHRGDGFRVDRPADLASVVAGLLAEGNVVARFAGREEFGARALGNRSILADPSRPGVIRTINEMIKNRDFWMPFACSVLAERQDDYLRNDKGIAAPYMILAFDAKERTSIAAGLHPYDFTVRPQVVTKEHNPGYHELISRFQEKTGIGAVLNTSFNLHGFPIVHTPQDAIDVLSRSGLDYLALGPYLIRKEL